MNIQAQAQTLLLRTPIIVDYLSKLTQDANYRK